MRFVIALLMALLPAATQAAERPVFILIHGAWGSGEGWGRVKALIEKDGYRVYAPSLPGQGERASEGGPGVNLSAHVADITQLIERERLARVILVGHSYGGMVVSGVAERVPDRIARVIYVDAFLPENGESAFSLMNPGFVAALRKRIAAPGGWGIATSDGKGAPQPVGTLEEPLTLADPKAAAIPGSYILTMEPGAKADAFSSAARRAQARIWPVHILRTGHLPQVTMPDALARLLLEAALVSEPIAGQPPAVP